MSRVEVVVVPSELGDVELEDLAKLVARCRNIPNHVVDVGVEGSSPTVIASYLAKISPIS